MSRANKRAAAVAPLYGRSVLLAKRAELYKGKPVAYGGYWSIFGGTVEDGENPMMCAVRELEEEAQIKIPLSQLKYIQTFHEGDLEFVFYICRLNELVAPVLNFEHTQYGWFDITALDTFTEKIDPKIVECIKQV